MFKVHGSLVCMFKIDVECRFPYLKVYKVILMMYGNLFYEMKSALLIKHYTVTKIFLKICLHLKNNF